MREDGVGQLCWTKRDTNLFKDVLEGWKEIPLYTHHAPSWQGLSDDEILELKIKHVDYELFDEGEYGTECNVYVDDFYHAIEQTLKEKNYGSV